LEPYFKSEEILETNDKAVKVVLDPKLEYTKLQIVKVVLDPKLEYTNLQIVKVVVAKLAELLKGMKSTVVAKMDGTKKEHANVQIEGFSTTLNRQFGREEDGGAHL